MVPRVICRKALRPIQTQKDTLGYAVLRRHGSRMVTSRTFPTYSCPKGVNVPHVIEEETAQKPETTVGFY